MAFEHVAGISLTYDENTVNFLPNTPKISDMTNSYFLTQFVLD